jgi:hypothetical protein
LQTSFPTGLQRLNYSQHTYQSNMGLTEMKTAGGLVARDIVLIEMQPKWFEEYALVDLGLCYLGCLEMQ